MIRFHRTISSVLLITLHMISKPIIATEICIFPRRLYVFPCGIALGLACFVGWKTVRYYKYQKVRVQHSAVSNKGVSSQVSSEPQGEASLRDSAAELTANSNMLIEFSARLAKSKYQKWLTCTNPSPTSDSLFHHRVYTMDSGEKCTSERIRDYIFDLEDLEDAVIKEQQLTAYQLVILKSFKEGLADTYQSLMSTQMGNLGSYDAIRDQIQSLNNTLRTHRMSY